MAKSAAYTNDLLKFIFNSIPIVGLLRNSVVPLPNLSVALHLADPGPTGLQSTSEIAYTGYARVLVTRLDSSGWIVSGVTVSPASPITFGKMTGGVGGSVTYVSIGTGVDSYLLYRGFLAAPINVVVGKIPRLGTLSRITEGSSGD